jgi:UDP-N-acetylglucosamine--N-acetylmuramyl-(pentapeptide) pyrophosphoryl-undecaprenol N-acetylglucosamine transferase
MNFADALREADARAEITALGTERGLDTTLIPARGYPLELIPPVPLPRRPGRDLLAVPARLAGAVRITSAVLERVDAEAVVGFGGYVAMPAYVAARRRGLPIIVHEANARPGVANRVAAWLTPHVFTASPAVRLAHASAIGIPLRPAIAGLDRAAGRSEARAHFGLRADLPVLLVTGGSQGARTINSAVSAAAPALRRAGVQVLHVAGPNNPLEVDAGGDVPYVVLPYVEQMHRAYAAADFAVCRSGAMTCAELSAVGLPAAYVPYPSRGAEQRFNAVRTVEAGGGLLVEDDRLNATWITEQVVPRITDPDRLAAMSQAAAHAGLRDAGAVLARRTCEVVARYRARSRAQRDRRTRRGRRFG